MSGKSGTSRPGANWRLTLMLAGTAMVAAGVGANGLGKKPPMPIGKKEPRFDFSPASGSKPTWSSLKGKVVVMDFWASWCTPCIGAFPKMNALKRAFAGKPVVFYSVTYETPQAVAPVLRQHPLETIVVHDDDFATFRSFGAWAIPAVYVFDKAGRLAAEINPEKLDARVIDAVLSGRRPTLPEQPGWDDPAQAEKYFRYLKGRQPA